MPTESEQLVRLLHESLYWLRILHGWGVGAVSQALLTDIEVAILRLQDRAPATLDLTD